MGPEMKRISVAKMFLFMVVVVLAVTMSPVSLEYSYASDSTQTVVKPNPSSVIIGKSVGFTVTVSDTSNSPTTPTGTVSWSDDAGGTFAVSGVTTSKCSLSSISSSASSCKITYGPPSTAAAGNVIVITAIYSADSTHSASSGTSTLTVLRAISTAVSPSYAVVGIGATVTYTATVSDTSSGIQSAPTGTLSWTASPSGISGTLSSGACTLVPINSSQSRCHVTYTPLIAGSRSITATYRGDSVHAKGRGQILLIISSGQRPFQEPQSGQNLTAGLLFSSQFEQNGIHTLFIEQLANVLDRLMFPKSAKDRDAP